jgi:hypothetical protein
MSDHAHDPPPRNAEAEHCKLFQQLSAHPLRPFESSFLIVKFPSFHRDGHRPGCGISAKRAVSRAR